MKFVAFLVAMIGLSSHAGAGVLLTNGGFETGDLTGWTTVDAGSGSIDVISGVTPGNSGNFPTAGPSSGSFYAVTSQNGPGTHALLQSFTVAGPISTAELTFDMFVQTESTAIVDPAGLDHTGNPNQHARVDILTGTAAALDTGAGVLFNFYTGIDGFPTQPYTSYTFDITALVGGGGTFQLRFAQSDNLGFFNLGVDNVQITTSSVGTVPEPSSIVIFSAIGLGVFGLRRRNGKVA
ncbi:PEP-CTERM sorting domain-containing protein [Rubripirellula tenax]|nr:PEP-CTERM sorting domain-containing protein [Rubripirellula tenax]